MLNKVVRFFTRFEEISVYRPSTGSSFDDRMRFINYGADTARRSTIYDRVGVIDVDSEILEGDIVTLGDFRYVVSSKVIDDTFGETVRYMANLIYAEDTVDIYRFTLGKDANGMPTKTRTKIYSAVPVGLRTHEIALLANMQIMKEMFYLLVPVGYSISRDDEIDFLGLTYLANYQVEGVKPFERGVYTCICKENRV